MIFTYSRLEHVANRLYFADRLALLLTKPPAQWVFLMDQILMSVLQDSRFPQILTIHLNEKGLEFNSYRWVVGDTYHIRNQDYMIREGVGSVPWKEAVTFPETYYQIQEDTRAIAYFRVTRDQCEDQYWEIEPVDFLWIDDGYPPHHPIRKTGKSPYLLQLNEALSDYLGLEQNKIPT